MLLTMRGDGSLGSRSCKTIHYSSSRCNNDDESSEEEGIEASFGEKNVVDIGLSRPATLTKVIVKFMKIVDAGIKIPATLPQVI